ncbi:KpsF/GutQ family sugar-phosphate isomerase [Thermodesulfovibrionales bacterium]|nr:KpsF/GutQ family sugar-phosphate isomerase [Thermodesulfovibrionales bacterium]MCL0086497.1 KpsF/GutQ family sugar-phosphate isomerase [Thermodesulfovibrionales bacterium]
MDDIREIGKKVLKIEADAVSAMAERLDSHFESAVDIISRSRGRMVVTGIGKSGLVGKKVAATLSSTGTPAFFLHPAEASHGDIGMVTSDDIIIFVSNSGETEELIRLIPVLKRFNVGMISMTGNHNSTLSKAADVTLDVSVKEEACPLGIVPTASTTAALAMGDAVAVALLVKRGLKKEDFALLHPGGNLGKKLLIKVEDLMHSGDALPVILPDEEMARAIIEISSKKLGTTIVADTENRILGIITDGDLRRGIERWGKKFFDMKAAEVMTENPKTVSKDELAVKALSIMENYSIASLVVPDVDAKAKGIIHIYDILKKGIV